MAATLQLSIGDDGLRVTVDGVPVAGVSGLSLRANLAGFYDVVLELGAVRVSASVLAAEPEGTIAAAVTDGRTS